MTDVDSFGKVVDGLRHGTASAAEAVSRRFTAALIGLARDRLEAALRSKVGPEDIVQSAYKSFFVRCRDGEFDLGGWADVWGLLVVITVRKCANARGHYRQARRDVGREGPCLADLGEGGPGRDPTPEEAVLLAEAVAGLLALFDPPDQQVLELSLQGYPVAEISGRLGRAERSVRRVRERARDLLRRSNHPPSP